MLAGSVTSSAAIAAAVALVPLAGGPDLAVLVLDVAQALLAERRGRWRWLTVIGLALAQVARIVAG